MKRPGVAGDATLKIQRAVGDGIKKGVGALGAEERGIRREGPGAVVAQNSVPAFRLELAASIGRPPTVSMALWSIETTSTPGVESE